MRVLLDTCTFLWVCAGAPELSATARELFQDPANDVYLSAVSAWEIAVKHALGRLPLPEPPQHLVPAMREAHGVQPLPLSEDAALLLASLPPVHRDPFDRMLVCQAIADGLTILTPDDAIVRYPVRTAW
ncbi:MAG: type II toxin-antitoxin system VapC family toxin [Thermoanaerobaculaceae bacterium]|nr:type II toxin-antitoxin system VapC family toxin [Thermoanaerobaculaceae bacterium]